MADRNLGTPSDHPDTNSDDENVTLTAGELDDLFGGAEVSEVSLESPEEENGEEVPSDDLAGDLPELPDLETPEEEGALPDLEDLSARQEEDVTAEQMEEAGDLPELPTLDLEDPDGAGDGETDLQAAIPEDLPTPEDLPSEDEMKDVELPELGGDGNGTEEGSVLENVEPEDDLPALSLDAMELPDLDDKTEAQGEEDVEILPSSAPSEGEDETVSLSEGELGNILSDVDESQVLELDPPSADEAEETPEDDEVVSVSGEELDSLTQDASDEIPSEIEAEDVTADSLSFEAEIMQDAQVELAKPADEDESALDETPAPAEEEEALTQEDLTLDTDLPELPELDLQEEPAAVAEPPAAMSLAEDASAPEDAFDQIQTIPAPPEHEALPEPDPVAAEETLEAIDLADVHEAARPPDLPKMEAPSDGSWDGSITEADLAGSPQPPGKITIPGAAKAKASSKVEDRELYDLLKYLDTLLEHLPEPQIRAFAESRHYDRYIQLINRLGL